MKPYALVPLALLVSSAAFAGSASEFAGTYDLGCSTASLTLHLGLAGGDATTSDDWARDVEVALDCDGVDAAEEAAFADALTAECVAAGLPEDGCADVADDVAAAVAAFHEDALAAYLPTEVTTRVGSYGWFWSGLLGLYPMVGEHDFASGTRTWSYLLDNNPGRRGRFAAAGLAVHGAGAAEHLACVDASVAAIAGGIDPASAFDLYADVGVDRSLVCVATDGVTWVAGAVGLTFDAAVEGTRR